MEDINLVKTYANVFLHNKEVFTKNLPSSLLNIREKALEDLLKNGIPSKNSEQYKYTDLLTLFNQKYDFYLQPDKLNFEIEEIFKCDVPQLNMREVLTLNGYYYHKNVFQGWTSEGIFIGSLHQALSEIPDVIEHYLNKTYTSNDSLISLNTLLFRDGLIVYIPKNKQLNFPLQLINLFFAKNDLLAIQRNLIILEENTSANIVFCDHTLSKHRYFANFSTEIFMAKNARLDLIYMQNFSNHSAMTHTTNVWQNNNTRLNTVILTLHGGLIRNNYNIKLQGEGAESLINGLYVTDHSQHVDNTIFIHHTVPHCISNQLFKGILDDTSTAAFTGRILVARDAQKTNAFQKCNNLLLTKQAHADARPQLEIYADDVKCTHGATTGEVDDEAIFYLQSRGIGAKEARFLLMFAFAYEVIQHIPLGDLKFRLEEQINKRLRKELSRCHNCQIIN